MDDEFGIYCRGNGKYGLTGNGVDFKANWNNNWRRPVNFEYFPLKSDTSVINLLGEMRVSGKWSRASPQKPLTVYANKRFGVKRFEYDLFQEKPNQEIKSFIIRNSGNDFWWTHFRDAAIQLFFGGKVDLDYQAYQPAIFYLNGKYWGIQNLRERSQEHFVLANYGIEDIDLIGNWWGTVKAGDKIAWNQLMTELRKSSSTMNYQWVMDQIDIDEFINYMILQIYVSNTDFPQNNMNMWRQRKEGSKWRFILKDTDHGLGIWDNNKVTHNALKYNTENNNDERKLFNALLTQDSFRKKFYKRFAVYMGDLLSYKSTSHIIDSIQNMLEPEMLNHLNRWLPEMWWRDMNSWRNEVTKMKTWCNGRNAEVYRHLREFFALGTAMQLTYEHPKSLPENTSILINGVQMRNTGLNATYFQKENIDLLYKSNSPFHGWIISKIVNGVSSDEFFYQKDLSFRIEEGCTLVLIKLMSAPTSIDKPALPDINLAIIDNQLHISDLHLFSEITIYDISGKLITKTSSTDSSIIIPFYKQGIYIVQIKNALQSITRKVMI